MKEIKLTKGQVTLVDDEDYEYLMQWKWCAAEYSNGYYAKRGYRDPDKPGKTKIVWMHRDLMKTPPELVCDHKDRNSLNNQKSNLRNCTRAQNGYNKILSIKTNPECKYRGVFKDKNRSNGKPYYVVWIQHTYIGVFPFTPEGEIEAAKAYDAEAIIRYGEFAVLNFNKSPEAESSEG